MKHNKWYIKNGNNNIVTNMYSIPIVFFNKLAIKLATIIPAIPAVKIAEKTMPQGSSDCLYTRDATFINFVFLIFATARWFCDLNQINGNATYRYANNINNLAPFGETSGMLQEAINAKATEIKILTLLKVQKPDFSITGELGNLLLKNAIAFVLLESILGFFKRLLGNIFYLLISKVSKFFNYYNTSNIVESS